MLKIPILHEDDNIIVVDKPTGVLVHSGNGNDMETLVDVFRDKLSSDDELRPGIVHRLDMDTSGLLVLAKDDKTKDFLQKQFQNRTVDKSYLAAVRGLPKPREARLELPIGRSPKNPMKRTVRPNGRMAITEYKVVDEAPGCSMLELKILTGRTHQIRVHMQYIGHPILGDELYGKKTKGLSRQFLHASKLSFDHPAQGRVSFSSKLPEDLLGFWYNQQR